MLVSVWNLDSKAEAGAEVVRSNPVGVLSLGSLMVVKLASCPWMGVCFPVRMG